MRKTFLVSMVLLVAIEDVCKFASTSVINYLQNQDMSFHVSFPVAKSVLIKGRHVMDEYLCSVLSSERKGVVHPFNDTFSLFPTKHHLLLLSVWTQQII